jgi:hypothetical protein
MEAIQVEKLYDDRLWIITVQKGDRSAVDAWEACVREYIATVSTSTELYLVYDTTGILNFGFTTYLQNRATVLAKDNRDVTGRVAIVVNLPMTIRYIIDSFMKWTGSRLQPHLTVRFYKNRDEAIAWVAEIIPENV